MSSGAGKMRDDDSMKHTHVPAEAAALVERAMILAAGRGSRMRPLTDKRPKPLLAVHGKPLIEWHIEALARSGVHDIVINTAWLEEQIPAALGDGSRWGVRIRYSMEGRDHGGALETAGGIAKAKPWNDGVSSAGHASPAGDCFWLVSADIYAPDFKFDASLSAAFARGDDLAHLWLVPNPPFHPVGDFALKSSGRVARIRQGGVAEQRGQNRQGDYTGQGRAEQGARTRQVEEAGQTDPAGHAGASRVLEQTRRPEERPEQMGQPEEAGHSAEPRQPDGSGEVSLTYANIALCRAALVESVKVGEVAALGPLLFDAADAGRIGGSRWNAEWENVGTPAQLDALNRSGTHPRGVQQ